MSLWRPIARGVRVLVDRPAAERELNEEVEHYLEQAMQAHLARGLPPDEARRRARLELGSEDSVREGMRGQGWERAVDTVLADVRHAARQLGSARAFTGLTVFILALGIAAATTIFSAVHPILFESLPYPEAGRLVAIWEIGRDGSRADGTFGMYRALSERSRSFAALAAFRSWQPTLTGADRSERLEGQRVSASYFDVLGVAPAHGSAFTRMDDRLGGRNVVLISDGLWRSHFGADPAVVGGEVALDGARYFVAGVMPRDFENVLAPSAQLWAPLQYDMSQGRAWGHHLRLVARLRPGVNSEAATHELNALGSNVLDEQRPETYGPDVRFGVTGLQFEITRGVRPALAALLGAVCLVLVLACVNAANLVLVRAAGRRGEFTLRAALGASRGQLVRQILTENLLLSFVAGAAALGMALVSVRALVAFGPRELPRLDAIRVDGAVLAFALLITAIVGLAFGAAPALQAGRRALDPAMRQDSPRLAGGRRRARSALVVAQVAVALVLLITAGLLLRSMNRLFSVDPGFDPAEVLTMQLHTVGGNFADDSAVYRFFEEALEAVRRVPGVSEAALTSQLPISGDIDLYGVHFDPAPSIDPGEVRGTFRYAVTPGYLRTMRIPLRSGRLLDASDRASAPLVAVVSESLARRRLPGLDPLGRRVRIGAADGRLYTVVGVVGDVRQLSLALPDAEAVYVPVGQWRFADPTMSLVIRARDRAGTLAPAVQEAVRSVDRHQPIVRSATFDQLLAASAGERRFTLLAFQVFAAAALLLAAAGIYAVLAASVTERTREIAIRSALGASRDAVVAMVLRHGMRVTAIGVAIGLVGGIAASRAMAALLFGVSPLDPITYAGVTATMAAVALVACGIPAWRAARIDPARSLEAQH